MSEPRDPTDIRTRIENTIAILTAEAQTLDEHARHDVHLAVDTLRAAQSAIAELDSELDMVTAPERQAADEAKKLRTELDAAELRIAGLEQELLTTRTKLELEDQMHAVEHDRLEKLKKRSAQMENLLETDAEVFGKFMDSALAKDEQKGRLKGRG